MATHPLREHLSTTGETQSDFAARAGLSEGFVSKLLAGQERCGANAALRIVDASHGALTLDELLR